MLSILHEEVKLRDLVGHVIRWPKDTVITVFKVPKGCTVVSEHYVTNVLKKTVYIAFKDNSGVSAEVKRAQFDAVN